MEPSNERQETTPKDAGADLDWNMLIQASFAIEAQAEADGLLAPEKLEELGYDGLAEPIFRIMGSQMPDVYADALVRKLSAEEIVNLLKDKADYPIIQFAITEAAARLGPAGDEILVEMVKNAPPEAALIALMRYATMIIDQDLAPVAAMFLQRDGLSIDVLKNTFEILESLSKESLATTTGVLKTFCKHESPEIRATAQPIFRKAMSGLVHEFLTAGHNTKPGEEMSPREQMIVNMKKELGAKLLKPRDTES